MIYLLEAREWEENQSQVQLFNDNNALKGVKKRDRSSGYLADPNVMTESDEINRLCHCLSKIY